MKYPQLVSDRAVSTISDWLVTRLEVLGVEAPIVYSRLLLSLLHTPLQVDSVDLADIPQLKNWLGKRFNSRRLTQSDAERLKRVAAIESLMDVVEANEKRSRIVELVSELCAKLRDLERTEDQQEFEQVIERQEPVAKTTMNSSGGVGSASASGAKTKETVAKAARSSNKSNPYYQMFPALSGNIPASNSTSRATSLSGGVMSESSTSGNWGGRGDAQQLKKADEVECEFERQRRQSECMMSKNGAGAQELHVTGGGGVDGGSNKGGNSSKRKNKKRRTNGPSAVPPPDNNTSRKGPIGVAAQSAAQSVAGCGTNRKKQPYVEWDTNFSGQWEMEERNPIQEFMKAQRTATTKTTLFSTSDNACESVASGSVRTSEAPVTANGYDNVFKMKCSDVNEEQTMLIKNFLTQNQSTPSQKSNNLTATKQQHHRQHQTAMSSKYDRTEMPPPPPPPTFGFGFDAAEEYFNLSLTEEEQGDTHRRLFEREVSSESLTASSGGGGSVFPFHSGGVTDMIEEPTTEFDAKLDAFKAKFDTNIRNLWSDDVTGTEHGEEEHDQQQPMSVNSFWHNYNKHLYEFQDNNGAAESFTSSSGGGGGWPQARMEEQQHLSYDQLGQKAVPALAIWSNSEFEDPQTSNLHSYNEHMAAAYNKQLAYGGGGGALDNNEHIDLFATCASAAAAGGGVAGSWSTTSDCTAEGLNYDVLMNNDELEQLYYSSGFPSVGDLQSFGLHHQDALMESIDDNNNINNQNHNDSSSEVANIVKLEQSIAMINHSSTSSFAKVDKKMLGMVAGMSRGGEGGGGGGSSSDGAGLNGARGGSLSASSSSTAITNMSSLYGSFKQNSMENLLTSERTHFRPIKQAYVDGHTFDIPCSPDTIEYVRSKSGSLFFELDKYMEYNVEPVTTSRKCVADADDDHLPQSSTNVPISRCGTIVSASEEGDEEQEQENEAQVKDLPPAPTNAKKFTLKFCVREENEKCCQTELIDYESLMMRRLASARTLADNETVNKYPKHVLPNVSTLVEDVEPEEVAYEVDSKWGGGISSSAAQNMSLLWENSDSTSLDSSLNYESLPANRLLRDELSADAEEILKDSLTYMQNLYIDDMDEEEEQGEEQAGQRCNGMGMGDSELGRGVNGLKNDDMDLANYYEMGQLISEILNPGAVQKSSQAGRGSEEDILWYKNWSQKNWLPTILDQSAAVVSSLCKDTRNVWHYGSSNLTMNSNNNNNNNSVEVNNNNINITNHNNHNQHRHHQREEEGVADADLQMVMTNWSSEKRAITAAAQEEKEDWKFSNLRVLWNDTQLILNEGNAGEQLSGLVIPVEGGEEDGEEEEEEEDDLLDGERDYHLIIFEKNGPSVAAAKGRKRRHSASQNLYDEDLEFFNGDDVKWYDYCCKCDCGKRSEKILKYRNKLLMKRVDKMGYVHNASLLLKNFSKQFDSIDEILNEGLICNAMASGCLAELCEYEVDGGGLVGEGGGVASEYCAEKLCTNVDQVSMLKNPNLYLNRTALISMARPLTR